MSSEQSSIERIDPRESNESLLRRALSQDPDAQRVLRGLANSMNVSISFNNQAGQQPSRSIVASAPRNRSSHFFSFASPADYFHSGFLEAGLEVVSKMDRKFFGAILLLALSFATSIAPAMFAYDGATKAGMISPLAEIYFVMSLLAATFVSYNGLTNERVGLGPFTCLDGALTAPFRATR